MRRFLNERNLYLLISLAIATTMWFYVASAQNPEVERNVTIDLRLRGLGANLIAVQAPRKIEVRLQGPRSALSFSEGMEAWADLSGLPPGEHRVPVLLTVPENVRVLAKDPREAVVVIEQRERREMAVEVDFIGTIPSGVTVGEPEVDPPRVVLNGPKREVDSVRHVLVTVDVSGLRRRQVFTLTPKVVSSRGEFARGVEIIPPVVQVVVSVKEEALVKVLPVVPVIQGTPAKGYSLLSVAVSPAAISVQGPSRVLDGLTTLLTAPVAIEGAKAEIVRQVEVRIPQGVQAEVNQVTVTVTVTKAVVARVIRKVPVHLEQVPSGLQGTVEPETVDVVVQGPSSVVEDLAISSISASVSAAGLGPGRHNRTPQIAVPPEVVAVETVPKTVTVVLRGT